MLSKQELEQLIGQEPADCRDRLFDDARNLPKIADCIGALAAYAQSLEAKCSYIKEGARYVSFPRNFVAFTPHYKRGNNVTIELRGSAEEFGERPELPLKDTRGGSYAICAFRNPSQLAAATSYIQRAHELYRRGRTRNRGRPMILEVSL